MVTALLCPCTSTIESGLQLVLNINNYGLCLKASMSTSSSRGIMVTEEACSGSRGIIIMRACTGSRGSTSTSSRGIDQLVCSHRSVHYNYCGLYSFGSITDSKRFIWAQTAKVTMIVPNYKIMTELMNMTTITRNECQSLTVLTLGILST